MSEPVVVGLIAFAGVVLTQYFMHRRWLSEQRKDQRARDAELKAELKEQRAQERAKDREQIETARSNIVTDATQMVDRYERAADEARAQWQQCEQEHRGTREELQRLGGRFEELRYRQAEAERTFGDRELEREKDRHVKHRALTALAVSEVAMSTVVKLTPRCECGAMGPIRELIDNWTPKHGDIVEENVMTLDHWRRLVAPEGDTP